MASRHADWLKQGERDLAHARRSLELEILRRLRATAAVDRLQFDGQNAYGERYQAKETNRGVSWKLPSMCSR